MSLLTFAKRLSILVGLYRPARRLSRRLRPGEVHSFLEDVRFFRSLMPAGALAFDVGANIGEKSEALLEAGARVVAFEPNPLVLPELQARCRHKEWTVVRTALGSGPAVATLHARKSHGSSSLREEWGRGEVLSRYDVPVITLDSAIRHFGMPFFCKIDVEGWELEVLQGLSQPLPLVSFEFHLNDRDIDKTLRCLRRLQEFGSGRINISPAEKAALHFEEWMLLKDFVAWFPGDLRDTLPGDHYGDIYVSNDAAQQQHAAGSAAPKG